MTINLTSNGGSSTSTKKPLWTSVAAGKVAARDALIPKEWLIPTTNALNVMDIPRTCGILSAAEIAITESEAPVLVERMVQGDLKSYDVVLAFCKRAAIAQQLVSTIPLYQVEDADLNIDKLFDRNPVYSSFGKCQENRRGLRYLGETTWPLARSSSVAQRQLQHRRRRLYTGIHLNG